MRPLLCGAAVSTRYRRLCPCVIYGVSQARRPSSVGRYLARCRVGTGDETSRDRCSRPLCAALLLPALAGRRARRQHGLRPDAGRWLRRRAAARPAACWSSTPKAARSSAPRAAGTPRPLASNMKLFTTATALAQLGPGRRGSRPRSSPTARSTPTASSTATSTCRAAATRPSARPAFYNGYLGGLGTNLFALAAAGPRRRDHARSPAASTATTRSSTACAGSPTPATRPAPTSARSPASPSTPASPAPAQQRLLRRPGQAGRREAGPRRSIGAGIEVSPQVALGDDAAGRRPGRRSSARRR